MCGASGQSVHKVDERLSVWFESTASLAFLVDLFVLAAAVVDLAGPGACQVSQPLVCETGLGVRADFPCTLELD